MISIEKFIEYIEVYSETFINNLKNNLNYEKIYNDIKLHKPEYLEDIDDYISEIFTEYLEK